MDKPALDSDEPKIPATYHSHKLKYTKTVSTSDATKTGKAIFEVKETTDIKQMIAFSIDLMYNKQFPHVKLRGFGKNMEKCVFIAEQMKRKVRNLHQINTIETIQTVERFVPVLEEEGYYAFEKIKNQTVLTVTLSRVTPLNQKAAGYQKPLESKFVSTRDPREYIRYVLEEKKIPTKKKLMSAKREGRPFKADEEFDDRYEKEGEGHDHGALDEAKNRDDRPFGQQHPRPGRDGNKGRAFYGAKEGESIGKDQEGHGEGQEEGKNWSKNQRSRASVGGKWGRDPTHNEDTQNRPQSEHRAKKWDSHAPRNGKDEPRRNQDTHHAENWDDDPRANNPTSHTRTNRPWKGPGEPKHSRPSDHRASLGGGRKEDHEADDHYKQDRNNRLSVAGGERRRRPPTQKDNEGDNKPQVDYKVTLAKFEPKNREPRNQDDHRDDRRDDRKDAPDQTEAPRQPHPKPRRPHQAKDDHERPHHNDDEYVKKPTKKAKTSKSEKWRKNPEVEYVAKSEVEKKE
jgi:hypothetical protein